MKIMMRHIIVTGLAILVCSTSGLAQAPTLTSEPAAETPAPAPRPVPPQAFPAPEEGFAALVAAIRARNESQALRVLGTAGHRLIRSGDPVADRNARERFLMGYDEKNRILRPAPDRAVLQIGDDDWPLPLPMLQRGGVWRFDSAAAGQEIVDRRIGRNELDTIETLRALADAQDEYAQTVGRHGVFRAYARRVVSNPGQRDGLYWPTQEGEPPSPLGPFVAAASAGGYARGRGDTATPVRGYTYRLLESQGPAAQGGAVDYVVNGRMIGGFAVIATPARYGVSGIKTFMVSHHGTVWEQDLGPGTAREAAAITSFDPDERWTRVAE